MINNINELKALLTPADNLGYYSTTANNAILNGQKILFPIAENEVKKHLK